MYKNKTVAVVIPAYNEESLIVKTITTIPDFVDKIIVVDDCSEDSTFEKISLIKNDKINLLYHLINRGVGATISTGYKEALRLKFDITVVMAGDNQMNPSDLTRIIDPIIDGNDYSKGNRFIIPLWKYIGNVVLSFFTRILTGYKISDCQNGYTAINKETLSQIDLDTVYPRYGMPNDFLYKLSKINAKVIDVYTNPVYHIGEKTGIKLKSVLPKISWLFLKLAWQKILH